MFSNSNLVSAFTWWLYRKVVHSSLSEPDGEFWYGEYYLNSQYGELRNAMNNLIHPDDGHKTWENQQYQIVANSIHEKFGHKLFEFADSESETTLSSLYDYCQKVK